MRVFLSALLVGLTALGVPQAAPQTSFGTITGVVVDASNTAVPGAPVTLLNGGLVERAAVTNPRGEFTFDKVPFGAYEIQVTMRGFAMARSLQVKHTCS